MQILSAVDAISPAFARTKLVLFAPRRLRTFFKLAAVATLAELSNGFNLRISNVNPGRLPHGVSGAAAAIMAALTAVMLLILVVGVAVGLVIFYCGSRMQLVMVDVVAENQSVIAPLWRKHGSRTWRWIGVKAVVFVGFIAALLLAMLPILLYVAFHFGFHAKYSGIGAVGFGAPVILGIVALVFLFLLLVLLLVAALWLTVDFVTPSIALENAAFRESLRRVIALCRREPGPVALYLLMRFLLSIVFGIGALFVLLMAILAACVPIGGLGLLAWFSLRQGGAGAHMALIGLAVLGGILLLAWLLLVYISVVGVTSTFFRAYALYFLGGRYPLLGDLLDRSTPPPSTMYMPSPCIPPYDPVRTLPL